MRESLLILFHLEVHVVEVLPVGLFIVCVLHALDLFRLQTQFGSVAELFLLLSLQFLFVLMLGVDARGV